MIRNKTKKKLKIFKNQQSIKNKDLINIDIYIKLEFIWPYIKINNIFISILRIYNLCLL